ncbi:DUF4011 domain-containing protein [bacterium]|nr:MAG: DUF4011 domain-containing protein [bacterium]
MSDAPSPRHKAVDTAREAWVRRLVDTSRRNNLLYFRDLKVGTLDFGYAKDDAVQELLMGAKVPIGHLVPDDPKAGVKLKEIARKALSNLEEKGLETLYLAYGMATWPVEDEGRPPEAAVVLVPVKVEGRRNDAQLLSRSGPPRVNLALIHALHDLGYDVEIDEEEDDALTILGRLQASVPMDGFIVRPRAVLGNFSFQKLAMVQDLRDRHEEMAANDLVAALAGDVSARTEVAARRAAVDPRGFDAISPDAEFMPLDADSSQQAVVYAVAQGSDGVIQGPPGCGKSQTIANLVATLVAEGKRVLFVAEKRAALEAVHKRLQFRGLGHLALDLHGATVSQKAVVGQIADVLGAIRTAVDPDDEALDARFEDRRARMVAHDRLMHSPAPPIRFTPYELQARLIEQTVRAKTRWRGADLYRIDRTVANQVGDLLDEVAGHSELFTRQGASPWTNAQLADGRAAQSALDAADRLATRVPETARRIAAFAAGAGLPMPNDLATALGQLELAQRTNALLDRFEPELFSEAESLRRALEPSAKGGFALVWAGWFDGEFKRAKARLAELTLSGSPTIADVESAADLSRKWKTAGATHLGRRTELPPALIPEVQEAIADAALLPLGSNELETLTGQATALVADEPSARALPRVREVERTLTELGTGLLLEEIRREGVPPKDWRALFDSAWTASIYDDVRTDRPELASFSGVAQSTFAEEFRALDRERTHRTAARVRRAHAEAALAAMNAHPEQTDRVRAETQRRARFRPLRRLLAEAPDVLPALCPCWMTSPLNVSQLIPADRALFDVVVFDEASQVLPEDAVCALLRGKRLVVAGDRHQLPPTIFFADGEIEDIEEVGTTGMQSLLDATASFIEPWPLLWHYRSRDERLIAFSNREIYGNLVTFPGTGELPCLSHVLVPNGSEGETSPAEVERVVELILAHAEAQIALPESEWRSLGVIAMGIKHAQRIEAALDLALEFRQELEPFFETEREERFFVKNLEQVQGDERDAIIISVGYGKDASGKLPYRFGPLLQEGGERRLNVAITRARRQMTVVSSFSHLDMDPERSTARGVVLLRAFLQYADSGGTSLNDAVDPAKGLDGFERDVYNALTARGIPLVPKFGTSGYRLDFAAAHPEHKDRFVLAIECDGPTYHAAPTARDRERLRQAQLESIGWRFYRIWSTDWFLHREREIEAAYAAWQDAVDASAEAPIEPIQLEQPLPEPTEAVPQREAPPAHAGHEDIADYSEAEMDAFVRWAKSDGILRTDDEIVADVTKLLGFARSGPKISRTIQAAIERTRE